MEQAAAHDPLIGARVGNYTVKEKLGEGGMGAVYMAEHPLIGKKVALKVLHPEFSSNEDVVARFFNEAKAVNDIQHPNIVDIVDYGVIPEQNGPNTVYFIMEFLDGRSLADIVRDEAPLAPERALSIGLQVADALAASHRANIVHRDLKPDNIILVPRRREQDFVKLLDFGIAKLTGDQPGSRRTRTGIVMGTPAYMSPEQCEGKGDIDHRTDVYALGIVLYEMLTGRTPFVGEGYGEILVQHLTQRPVPPSTVRGGIPPHVELVCLKALEKSAAARYQTMVDMMAALQDPVGFVNANGGLEGFLATNLHQPVRTPAPGSVAGQEPLTPAPLTPVPGLATPPPGAVDAAAPRRRWPLIAALALVALGGAAGVTLALQGGGGDEASMVVVDDPETEEEVAAAPAPAPLEETAPPPTEPAMVNLSVSTRPAGATVLLGGEPIGVTSDAPVEHAVPRGDEPLALILRLDGYEDERQTFVPNKDGKLDIALTREQVAEKPTRRRRPARKRRASRPAPSEPTITKPAATEPAKKPRTRAGDDMLAPDL